MSIEQITATAPATPAVDTSDVTDFSQRVHMVSEAARAESKAEQREEAEADGSLDGGPPEEATDEEAPAETPAAEAKPAAPVEPSAEEKNRKASLANAARLERESVKRSAELASKAAEIKVKEQAFAERDAKLAAFEKAYNDPDALLSLLAEKVTPEKMSQFFIEAGNPDKVAERRAKAAQEPVSQELQKLREELESIKKESADKEASFKAKEARQASEKDFSNRVLELKADVPQAARLLSKRPQEFFAMADMAATTLMAKDPAATWDDVIQDINRQLVDFAKDIQDEAPQAAPSTPETPNKKSAAAKASTVSNRAASDRSTIVADDEQWENLSYDERVRRAEKRVRLVG